MREYNFSDTEKKWQRYWAENQSYRANENSGKPKYYVLTMFPYPSGSGLHVGHPLGYVAADIFARFKRHKGFEVLHPMGFDAFGLPAEQYAIQTGKHPAQTTEENINRYKEQLQIMGLSYDWSREVRTSDPAYYRWTQWIFLQLFNSWFNKTNGKAESIESLVAEFEMNGNQPVNANGDFENVFTAEEWKGYENSEKESILQHYRLAYLSHAEVNWCEELGTVLANDEVINGVSERGGHPVVRKKMRQWFLRITAYADRLLQSLNDLDWPDPLKEMQRNWIGRSEGAELDFAVRDHLEKITVFTTRPDTVFGSTFLVMAPEHPLLTSLVTESQKHEVDHYLNYVKSRSERERISEQKNITGVFTGSYAINPLTKLEIPIWTSEYVLNGYGTGAIMAVPAHDSRDYAFAKKFNLQITQVVDGGNIENEAYETKIGVLMNSGFLNGLKVEEAIAKSIAFIEGNNFGKKRVNYRFRDAGFSRQRYWGEPFPIIYTEGIPVALSSEQLPIELPEVVSYKPIGTGESPIAAVKDWVELPDGSVRETDTMPGYAGSSWYWLRYMDPNNNLEFVGAEKENYWKQVDLYIGGAEHAVGHLLYSRLWQKVLFDLGLVTSDEPFKKMINQGMIMGSSKLLNRIVDHANQTITYVSAGRKAEFAITDRIHIDINLVNGSDEVDLAAFLKSRNDSQEIKLELENGVLLCDTEVEKMSKRWHNVVNPEDVIQRYGADTFRMYEMFLGPITDSKPWNTQGIDGVFKFIRKLYNLFHNANDQWEVSNAPADKKELKILHHCIKKVDYDISRLSLNTCVSHMMICVNELQSVKCNKREILSTLTILLSPFAPHLAEELWSQLGNTDSILEQPYPIANEQYLVEENFEYPIMINGKLRSKINLPLTLGEADVKNAVLQDPTVVKWLGDGQIKKLIFVHGKIINLVIA